MRHRQSRRETRRLQPGSPVMLLYAAVYCRVQCPTQSTVRSCRQIQRSVDGQARAGRHEAGIGPKTHQQAAGHASSKLPAWRPRSSHLPCDSVIPGGCLVPAI